MSDNQSPEDEYFQELGPAPEMWEDKRGCLGSVLLLVLVGGVALVGIF